MIPLGVLASGYVAPAGGGNLTLAYHGNYAATSGSPVTINIGSADSTRTVVVVAAAAYDATASHPTATLGSTSMTEDLHYSRGAANAQVTVWSLPVATGTTASLTVTSTQSVFVYTITGASISAADTGTGLNSAIVTCPAGAVVVAATTNGNRNTTFTGVTTDKYWNYSGTLCTLAGSNGSPSAGDLTVESGGSSYKATAAVVYTAT